MSGLFFWRKMPELPEVENIVLAMREKLVGKQLTEINILRADIFEPSSIMVHKAISNRILKSIHRHGKYIILGFDKNNLMIHLRMTGQLILNSPDSPDKHTHALFRFGKNEVRYRDIRRFGRLTLVDDPENPTAIHHVGPDMLKAKFKPWFEKMSRRKIPIKSALLDQGIASGIGNIYADEALFLAGIHPLAKPCELTEKQLQELFKRSKQVLRLAIKHGGTTFMDFRDFSGKPGNFRRKLRVFQRNGEPCKNCHTTLAKIKVGGRGTHFCPLCQSSSDSLS
jgi:formamidopyrimidine-DNA glycosylase